MAVEDKLAGIIGGMGPEATVDFMLRVINATPATIDQDHVRVIAENNPRIPSRQLAIRGEGPNPGPAIAAIATRLENAGADFLVMPCNLAHAWQGDVEYATNIPFVSIIDVTVEAAVDRSDEDSAVGLMTTPGCFAAGLYQQALADAGRPVVTQTHEELSDTMAFVERIKGGEKSQAVTDGLHLLAKRLVDRGARVLIAACTEFPLVLDESMFDVAFIASTDELAKKTVALALGNTELNS